MNHSLESLLFSPLSKKYCVYFYFFSVLGLLGLLLCIFDFVVYLVGFKSMGLLPFGVSFAFIYFQNRLLYSMCVA